MARFKRKKRNDGRIGKCFTVDKKRYFVYGRTEKELAEKEQKRREELKKEREELERKQERRTDPTLDEYHEKWKENRPNNKKSTYATQKHWYKACNGFIISAVGKRLGDMKLKDIKADDIREVQGALFAEGKSAETINSIIKHLRHIFKTAMYEGYIERNPCRTLERLPRTEAKARDTIHRALTLEETEAFFKAAEGNFYYNVFRFALNTGMRCGEIGALMSGDIRDGFIHVERTITKDDDGRYIVGDMPKTESGRRRIGLTDRLKEIIDNQKQINRFLDEDRIVPINDLIFKASRRGLLNDSNLNVAIKSICGKAGLEYFTMHAFRSTFATRHIEQGMNPKTLQELLGHSDYNITMSLYGHVMDNTIKNEMENVDMEAWRKKEA